MKGVYSDQMMFSDLVETENGFCGYVKKRIRFV